MQILVDIPDELVARGGGAEEIGRQIRTDAAVGAYCRDAITRTELQRLLGFGTGDELDGFLKERGIAHGAYRAADLADDVRTLETYGVGKSWLAEHC